MVKKDIKMGKLQLPLDVRSTESIPAFEDLISKGPMAIVLVYADWCGHCTKYKDNVWSPLKSTKNRTMNMASVHYDQLENTSLKGSKIEGYPSLLVVGTDKEPATFNSDSGVTNAMPNANDLKTMQRLVSTPVSTMKSKERNVSPSLNVSPSVSTLSLDNDIITAPEANTLNIGDITPPNIAEDNVTNAYEENMGSVNALASLATAKPSKQYKQMNPENNTPLNTQFRNLPLNENTNENDTYDENANANSGYEENANSGMVLNTATNIPRKKTQGTTPIVGGRLYKMLTSKKRRSPKKNTKKKKTNKKRKN